MRVDLPNGDEEADPWADGILAAAASVGADAVIVILYQDGEIGAGELPRRALADALQGQASRHALDIREVFIVGADYWGDFRYPDGPRAPAAEIAELDGRFDGLPDVSALAAGAEGMHTELGGEAAAKQRRVVNGLVEDEHEIDAVVLAARALAEGPQSLDALTAAKLSTLSQVAGAREEVLTTLIAGAAEAKLLSSCTGPIDEPDDCRARTAQILMGTASGVSVRRLERALELWQEVTARTIPEQLPPVLGILAWLHWATGMRSVGAACAERAIELDVDYGFPRTVLAMIDAGHMPNWYQEQVTGHTKASSPVSGYQVRSEP